VLDDPPVSGMCSEYERRGIRFCITDPKWLRDGLLELPIKFHLLWTLGCTVKVYRGMKQIR